MSQAVLMCFTSTIFILQKYVKYTKFYFTRVKKKIECLLCNMLCGRVTCNYSSVLYLVPAVCIVFRMQCPGGFVGYTGMYVYSLDLLIRIPCQWGALQKDQVATACTLSTPN